MSEHKGCGHTSEEHDEMLDGAEAEIIKGNFAPLFQVLSNKQIVSNLQSLVLEIFLRSENNETFVSSIRAFAEGAINELVEHPTPEMVEILQENRAAYSEAVKAEEFSKEAKGGLDELFDQHGLANAPTPEISDEEWPGQYL